MERGELLGWSGALVSLNWMCPLLVHAGREAVKRGIGGLGVCAFLAVPRVDFDISGK